MRLGVVREAEAGRVRLLRDAFLPDARLQEARQLLAGAVADHLAAGVHNLTGGGPGRFLEQSVFADGLSADSVHQLHQLANRLWAEVLERVVAAAVPLCEQDEGLPDTQRFRLGLFSFSALDGAAAAGAPAADSALPPPESPGATPPGEAGAAPAGRRVRASSSPRRNGR